MIQYDCKSYTQLSKKFDLQISFSTAVDWLLWISNLPRIEIRLTISCQHSSNHTHPPLPEDPRNDQQPVTSHQRQTVSYRLEANWLSYKMFRLYANKEEIKT